ncbi:MAG TPA: oligopeptide/dipeptide ABC transporter ATP-binding protein [Kineosporiaceae bacterium]
MTLSAAPSGPSTPLLEVKDLVVRFPVRGGGLIRRTVGHVRAVDGISLQLDAGETLALVGESGCGKSTSARAILQLLRPSSGSVRFDGQELTTLSAAKLQPFRRDLQIVFQDPYSSLNPRMTVNDIVAEPLRIHGQWDARSGKDRVAQLLRRVGLHPEHGNRYPHEFSGGQRQRVGIARALALEPRLLVLDEPVSALDVSVQAGIVNLLQDLQAALGLAYLFIAHDLPVVRHVSDRVAVMYLGRVVETGPRDVVYAAPLHPYTQALLTAAPVADPGLRRRPERGAVQGEIVSLRETSSGCGFRSRCAKAQDVCAAVPPALTDHGQGRLVACHFAEPGCGFAAETTGRED